MQQQSFTAAPRRWFADIRQDVRYAARTLRKSPGFAAVAVLTLGLGIGVTTAIYAIVDTVLLQPLPFRDSDRLVRVIENVPPFRAGDPAYTRGLRWQEFLEWRERTTALSEAVGVSPSLGLLKTSHGTARLWGAMTSGATFPMLGTQAMIGRTLVPADDANPDVVLLTYDAWRRLFLAAPDIAGQSVEFLTEDGSPRIMTVVGVLPADFEFPVERFEFFTPFTAGDAPWKQWASISLIGRVRPSLSLDAAAQEALTIGTAVTTPPPATAQPMTLPRFEIRSLKEDVISEMRPALRVFLAAVAVVLLIVCANVANLLMTRGAGRQREIAVRVAIGATRGRIVRQVLTECLVLAALGGALGAVVGAGGVALVKRLASVDAPGIFRLSLGTSILPRMHEAGIDAKVFATALALTLLTTVAFGILPALLLSRRRPAEAFAMRNSGAGRGASRLRSALAVGQLVMATVLLVCAGLLLSSFARLVAVDRGYDPANVVAFQLVFPPAYSIARKTATIEAILTRLRLHPDIAAAGFTRHGMLIGEQITIGTFVPQGRPLQEMRDDTRQPSLRPVSAGYLTAVGARVLEGTDLKVADAASPPGILISRSTARLFGPGRQVGRLVDWVVKDRRVLVQVVGVVEDLRNATPDREPFPEVFIDYRTVLKLVQELGETPLWQHERAIGLLSFSVRTRGSAAAAVPAIGQMIRSVDANAGIDAILPLDRLVSSSVARPRFFAVLVGLFAGVAGLLAALGIYGVLAYTVTQRTQEIGVRMALGAERRQVLALVMRRGVLLTIAGIGIGLAAAAAGTRVLQGMLFGVTPLDPPTFAAVSVLFGLVATLASYVPARRATKVDPMVALRAE